MKKLLLLLMSLTLVFMLFSCGDECTEHTDSDGDGKCDVCDAEVKIPDGDDDGDEDLPPLTLIENGEAKFQIVISEMSGTKVKNAVEDFIDAMKKLKVDITLIKDSKEANIKDCEILVGDVSSRGEKYDYDEHKLGIKGSIITRIDNKIIITADSTDKIVETFNNFCKNVIGYKKGADKEDVANVIYDKSKEAINIQDDYRITSVKIGANEITGYTIAVDQSDFAHFESAKLLQKTLYERAGYWLDIVTPDKASAKSIVFKNVEKNGEAGSAGFVMKTVNGQLQILCAYDNALSKALYSAIISKITIAQGEYVLADNKILSTQNVSTVYSDEWEGIKGDGRTNDFEALMAMHEYANEGGQKVVYANKDYLISRTYGKSIIIQTDVDFGNASFTIDDSFIVVEENIDPNTHQSLGIISDKFGADRTAPIFKITSKLQKITYTINNDPEGVVARINANGGLPVGTTEIPLDLGFDAMIIPYDTSKRIYRRWGQSGNTSQGQEMSEIIVVDKNNKVDMTSTNMFDFDVVDKIEIYPIDEETLTITGGTFETKATRDDIAWSYIDRNILITRSNVVIDGMKHPVDPESEPLGTGGQSTMGSTGTGLEGPNYSGWFYPTKCTDITLKNCWVSGRVHYNNGSYDIGGNYANNFNLINCTQYEHTMFDPSTGFLRDENKTYWGVMGTNFCKNITLDGCTLSRFDAHAGVYNFTIKDTKIGFIKAVGGGTATIVDTEVYNYGRNLITLREDYAASWDGDFYIKNVTMVSPETSNNIGFVVFSGSVHDAEFGLYSVIPNVYIENFTARRYDGSLFSNVTMSLFNLRFDPGPLAETGVGNKNRITPATSIVIKQPAGFEFPSNLSGSYPFPFYVDGALEIIPWDEE